ncbi:hypothetical protein COFR110785_06985 [Corynebacterium frankenforstense]
MLEHGDARPQKHQAQGPYTGRGPELPQPYAGRGTGPLPRYAGGPEKQQPNATAMTTKGAAAASSAARNRSYFFLVTAR